MCVHRGCSVHWEDIMSTSVGYHEYIRGLFSTSGRYNEHIGGCQYIGDTLSTLGDIVSTSGDFSTSRDTMSTSEGGSLTGRAWESDVYRRSCESGPKK